MKASFDGARMNLAMEFNELARTELSPGQREVMGRMRSSVAGLLCMYDEGADDCHCLMDEVQLEEIQES